MRELAYECVCVCVPSGQTPSATKEIVSYRVSIFVYVHAGTLIIHHRRIAAFACVCVCVLDKLCTQNAY